MQNTNTNTNTNTNGHQMSLFVQSQIATIGKDNIYSLKQSNTISEQQKQIKTKKNKKNKKKVSFKKLLRSMTKSTKTDEQRKTDFENRLRRSLGGGQFNKIDSI